MVNVERKSQLYSVAISLALHVLAFIGMFFIRFTLPDDTLHLVLDSVFSEERLQEEFERDIEETTEVATTMNMVESNSISTAIGTGTGGDGGAVGTGGSGGIGERVEAASSLKVPTVPVRVGEISVPGAAFVAEDLGTGAVKGEPGRVVEGYGPALSQLTQELVRLMREDKLHVVWLFDESESMRDDQKEIRDKFHKVYEELGLVAKSDSKSKASDEVLLTSIVGYGENFHELTPKPTAKIDEIREAIDRIGVDGTGIENTCKATSAVLSKYGSRSNRRLAIVIVSDESGNDGELIEDTIERARKVKAPVYLLGRYSCFGYPYARMTWQDPKYKLTFWLTINRGPETPFPELLQTDGLHERWDYDSSGFGPFEQVRLARESGGIFFLLPGHEDNISGSASIEDRKFESLDMREYLPTLEARIPYSRERDGSKFRAAQWAVINVLSPFVDPQLQIQETHYSVDHATFDQQGAKAFTQAVRSLQLFNEALRTLDAVKPLREKEQSQRWRANYDLIHAQCKAYRVRLFQFLLALDKHKKERPPTMNPIDNHWHIVRRGDMLPPDPVQVKLTKVDMDELNQQLEEAKEEFQAIIANHPRTPWARRALAESNSGYGMHFYSAFHDYEAYAKAAKEIKVPTP